MMLTEIQAAAYLGMSVHYLRKDRCSGTIGNRTPGPRYFKMGNVVRYKQADLDDWLKSCAVARSAHRLIRS